VNQNTFSEVINRMSAKLAQISLKELERLLFIENNYEKIVISCVEKKMENPKEEIATPDVITSVIEIIKKDHHSSSYLNKPE
jgi:hypothetical protein